MSLQDKISSFLNSPFPLWETELTNMLVKHEWQRQLRNDINQENYSTAGSYFQTPDWNERKPILLSGDSFENSIFLEYPSFDRLGNFYEDHGLVPELENSIRKEQVQKLQAALGILNLVPEVKACISLLVKRIQVLRQDDEEIDTSYSHPEIPFTIFVSLCKDDSMTSSLRVAESILHEAMHLKLTLIEKHTDLIVQNTTETFYSPWRDEQRPVRGVLHGLFVFRAVLDYYNELRSEIKTNQLDYRKSDITEEINSITDFYSNHGLTLMGANLTRNLLPLN